MDLFKSLSSIGSILTDRRILVTGAAGAIGGVLAHVLAQNNEVVGVDNLASGRLENVPSHPNVTFYREDILNDEAIERIMAEYDVVFHLAASFANQNSIDHPQRDLLVNTLGTVKMLDWSRRFGVKRFVFSSSSCVYGNCAGAVNEGAPRSPETPYAISKQSAEEYVRVFARTYELNCVVLRYFNAYGPGELPGKYRNVIPNFVATALRGEPLRVFGTGDETRDFTFVLDTVQGTLLAGARPDAIGEDFNIGSGVETSVRRLAELVNRCTGSNAGIVSVERRTWDVVQRRCADVGKARRMLGYRPGTALEDGLPVTVEWLTETLRQTPPAAPVPLTVVCA